MLLVVVKQRIEATCMATKPTEDESATRTGNEAPGSASTDHPDITTIQRRSEDLIHLADRSPDAIYRFDIESRTFSFFNRRFFSLFAGEENGKQELSPQSVRRHIHPGDHERIEYALADSLAPAQRSGEIDYRYLKDDGSIRIMQDRWSVVRDPGGQIVAIEGFIRDTTGCRRADQAFERSIRNALIGCYIVQDARLMYVNPEFMRITGYGEAELIGSDPLTLVQTSDRAETRSNAIAMLKARRRDPYTFCITDKTGNTKWILETATSIQYNDKRAALCYFMDISQGKQAEAERLAKEKLLSILELAGAVGHELNNPLQVVMMGIEKLAPEADADARRTRLYQLLKNNLDRLVATIRKFQNITRYATKDYVGGEKILDIEAASADPHEGSGRST
ncbi:hypothetical protein JCM12296A_51820 [Desulfosarcina cetonica]